MDADLANTHVAITGATSGIGRAAALELASRGARLTLFCRDAQRAAGLADEIVDTGGVRPAVIQVDMASMASVREAGAAFAAGEQRLDVLLNNAGVVNTRYVETEDGFEQSMAVNHFAHFLLTGLLLPALRRAPAARVVTVSSGAHAFVRGLDYDDFHARRRYRTFRQYGASKLANILFTRELAGRLAATGITANCLHPGAVSTALGTQNGGLVSQLLPALLKPFFRSPAQGARTSIYLCASEDVANITGSYFIDCREALPKPWARDEEAAARLWQYTESTLDFVYPL